MDSNTAMVNNTVNVPMFQTSQDIEITLENVIEATPLQLAKWLVKEILSVRIPDIGPNSTLDVKDLMPLMQNIANRIAVVTEFFVVVVGANPTASYVRSSNNLDTKAAAESLSRKKDELYRTLQTLESMRETVSRMMTGMVNIDKLNNRYGQW